MEMPKGTGSTLSPPTPPIHHNDTSSMPRRPKNKNKEKHKGATSELSAEAAKEAPNKYFAPSESTKPQYILYPELETRLLEWIRLMRQTNQLTDVSVMRSFESNIQDLYREWHRDHELSKKANQRRLLLSHIIEVRSGWGGLRSVRGN
ncbi:hypothetical protein PC122_g20005 [Phytophthora cactorum]|nr:hypothetical protein PC122_g20005 [Phytophthora cactorum]